MRASSLRCMSAAMLSTVRCGGHMRALETSLVMDRGWQRHVAFRIMWSGWWPHFFHRNVSPHGVVTSPLTIRFSRLNQWYMSPSERILSASHLFVYRLEPSGSHPSKQALCCLLEVARCRALSPPVWVHKISVRWQRCYNWAACSQRYVPWPFSQCQAATPKVFLIPKNWVPCWIEGRWHERLNEWSKTNKTIKDSQHFLTNSIQWWHSFTLPSSKLAVCCGQWPLSMIYRTEKWIKWWLAIANCLLEFFWYTKNHFWIVKICKEGSTWPVSWAYHGQHGQHGQHRGAMFPVPELSQEDLAKALLEALLRYPGRDGKNVGDWYPKHWIHWITIGVWDGG